MKNKTKLFLIFCLVISLSSILFLFVIHPALKSIHGDIKETKTTFTSSIKKTDKMNTSLDKMLKDMNKLSKDMNNTSKKLDYSLRQGKAHKRRLLRAEMEIINENLISESKSTQDSKDMRDKSVYIDSCQKDSSNNHRTICLNVSRYSLRNVKFVWTAYEGKPPKTYPLFNSIPHIDTICRPPDMKYIYPGQNSK